MKAFFELNNVRYLLRPIRKHEFDEIMKDRKVRKIVAYPAVWCVDTGRVWPNPPGNIEVKFE
jgi:hypothetical protein